jgi:hypothetical protein
MVTTAILTRTIEIKDTTGGYRAPKYTHVRRGDNVTFVNQTDSDVSIQFSKNDIFHPPHLRVKKGGEETLRIHEDAPDGFHPYAVFCHEREEFAVGGSMPIIIVDPRT